MVIVDTNVLVDVLQDDPDWADWSVSRMRELAKIHELAINPIIYAELSLSFDAAEDLDAAIASLELKVVELSRPALFLAGKAFLQYCKRRTGTRTNVLPDFFIGAQAAVLGCPILTRDSRRYHNYFPTTELIVPQK
jgi:predicted nucleic acid-binding protein